MRHVLYEVEVLPFPSHRSKEREQNGCCVIEVSCLTALLVGVVLINADRIDPEITMLVTVPSRANADQQFSRIRRLWPLVYIVRVNDGSPQV